MFSESMRTLSGMAVAIAVVCSAGAAHATAGYDFQYKFSGERAILPLQVFDDGENTYFQWRSAAGVVPAILADTDGGLRAVAFERSGLYIVVKGVARSFKLRFGSLEGLVEYRGAGRNVASGAIALAGMTGAAVVPSTPAAIPQAAPPATGGVIEPTSAGGVASELRDDVGEPAGVRPFTPLKSAAPGTIPFAVGQAALDRDGMEAVRRAFQGKGVITSVTIVGRDDPVMVEGLARARAMSIRAAAIRAGALPSVITVHEGRAREGEGFSGSDISVVRAAPVQKVKTALAEPESVAEAMSLIQRGLRGLVGMGRISADWADGILAALKRMLGDNETPAAPVGLKSTSATERASAEPMTKVVATLYGEGAHGQAMWAMLPADGTAQQGLRKWALSAGVEVVWEADVDYPITKPIFVRGTARTAIETVRRALETAQTPLTIEYQGDRLVVRNLQKIGMTA